MSEREWRTLCPCEIQAFAAQRRRERAWWSSRFVAVAAAFGATGPGGSRLQGWHLFPELADE